MGQRRSRKSYGNQPQRRLCRAACLTAAATAVAVTDVVHDDVSFSRCDIAWPRMVCRKNVSASSAENNGCHYRKTVLAFFVYYDATEKGLWSCHFCIRLVRRVLDVWIGV